jgi:hypothetical protein
MDRMDDKLASLWADYRAATPDSEPGPEFLPKLWQRIDARRAEPLSIFRRLAQVCVMTTLALALLMSVLIPELQQDPGVAGSYVDVLAAEIYSDNTALPDVNNLL